MTTSDEQIDRQLAIWTGLYGPARANDMTEELRRRAADDPGRALAELVAEIDPDDDDDWESGGLSRPGVG